MQNQQQILQTLAQLMQKNRQPDVPLASAPPPPAYSPRLPAPTTPGDIAQKGSSTLGFLGGLGDTSNAVTGVADPSILTQLNQYLMNQAGQAAGVGSPLPWQTTGAQKTGQSIGSSLMKLFGG